MSKKSTKKSTPSKRVTTAKKVSKKNDKGLYQIAQMPTKRMVFLFVIAFAIAGAALLLWSAAANSTISLPAVADTYVDSARPDKSLGNAKVMYVDKSGPDRQIMLIKFDLSSLKGKKITSAKLKLYIKSGSSATQTLQSVDSTSWNEDSLNYKSLPKLGSSIGRIAPKNKSGTTEVNITPYIISKLGGFASVAVTSTSRNTLEVFSKEHSAKSAPTLVIDTQGVAQPKPPTNSKPQPEPKPPVEEQPPAQQSGDFKKLTPGTSWQWQISGTVDPNILDHATSSKKMIDIDMFNATPALISQLKAKNMTVVCYMETGSWENYRSDAGAFPTSVLGKTLDGYANERYLDITSPTVKELITKRLDLAKSKGCDGIEPDIDDAYFEDFNGNYNKTSTYTGFSISYQDQVNYNKAISAATHARKMSYGLKNGADAKFVQDLLPSIDWVLNEQCFQYSECDVYKPVIAANKAVFQVEYKTQPAAFCSKANALNFDSLKKNVNLEAQPRTACRNG